MEDLVNMARAAKNRLKTNYWENCKKHIDENTQKAQERGVNEAKYKSVLKDKVKNSVNGEKVDEFYLKVKNLLETEGEVSDAIGRLTDREYYDTLSYEEKQRYSLDLSTRYLAALKRYRKEKELGLI